MADLYERRAELPHQSDAPAEVIAQNKTEIFTLEKMVEQTGLAVSSLSARRQTGGFGNFDIDPGLH